MDDNDPCEFFKDLKNWYIFIKENGVKPNNDETGTNCFSIWDVYTSFRKRFATREQPLWSENIVMCGYDIDIVNLFTEIGRLFDPSTFNRFVESNNITKISTRGLNLPYISMKFIFDFLKQDNKITTFDLSTNRLLNEHESIQALTEIIDHNVLKELDVEYCGINIESAIRLFKSLESNTSIKLFDICNNSEIGQDGVNVCGTMLSKNFTLKHLYMKHICNDDINVIDMHDIADALCSCNSGLESLSMAFHRLSENSFDSIERMLAINKRLLDFTITISNFNSDNFTKVMNGLASNRTLKVLRLYNNNLINKEIKQLCRAITGNHVIKHIDLSVNSISDEGAIDLANTIPSTRLCGLFLSRNNIGPEGAKALFQCACKLERPMNVTLHENDRLYNNNLVGVTELCFLPISLHKRIDWYPRTHGICSFVRGQIRDSNPKLKDVLDVEMDDKFQQSITDMLCIFESIMEMKRMKKLN